MLQVRTKSVSYFRSIFTGASHFDCGNFCLKYSCNMVIMININFTRIFIMKYLVLSIIISDTAISKKGGKILWTFIALTITRFRILPHTVNLYIHISVSACLYIQLIQMHMKLHMHIVHTIWFIFPPILSIYI